MEEEAAAPVAEVAPAPAEVAEAPAKEPVEEAVEEAPVAEEPASRRETAGVEAEVVAAVEAEVEAAAAEEAEGADESEAVHEAARMSAPHPAYLWSWPPPEVVGVLNEAGAPEGVQASYRAAYYAATLARVAARPLGARPGVADLAIPLPAGVRTVIGRDHPQKREEDGPMTGMSDAKVSRKQVAVMASADGATAVVWNTGLNPVYVVSAEELAGALSPDGAGVYPRGRAVTKDEKGELQSGDTLVLCNWGSRDPLFAVDNAFLPRAGHEFVFRAVSAGDADAE